MKMFRISQATMTSNAMMNHIFLYLQSLGDNASNIDSDRFERLVDYLEDACDYLHTKEIINKDQHKAYKSNINAYSNLQTLNVAGLLVIKNELLAVVSQTNETEAEDNTNLSNSMAK